MTQKINVEQIKGQDYSTTEQDTGAKWIDGKAIYKKTINFGVMPNNATKGVAHGISSLYDIVRYEAATSTGAGGATIWRYHM